MANDYNGPDFGLTIEGPSTLNKTNEQFITTINAPNLLHQFASYTSLFTLSALSRNDLVNTTSLLDSKPHDIILRSGGIGPNENQTRNPLTPEDKKILDESVRIKGGIEKSRDTLQRNRDLYIKSVNMNSVPGLNDKRRLTSVTQIEINIVEPAGITLIERIRGAAINNGYLDHLDAPYLLTIDFQGFDELGNPATAKDAKNMKRVIPIKINDMQMDVNQGGTVYSVKAIPYNEFGFVNRMNFPRTAGQLQPIGRKLSDVFVSLEKLLNKQNQDEEKEGKVEFPDVYTIAFDNLPDGIEDVELDMPNLDQTGMASQGVTGADGGFYVANTISVPPDYMKINTNNAITQILENIMKGHPAYTDKKYKAWTEKVKRQLNIAQFKGGAKQVLEAAQNYFFDYFKIRASVVPIPGKFDRERAMNQKHITFHVEPYKVHAYSLAIPGVSTGQNFKNFVFKKYNYIFTGDNVDVLDVNINYNVAYFQSRLKDLESTDGKGNVISDAKDKPTGGVKNATQYFTDQDFLLRSSPGTAKQGGTGKTGGTPTQLDSFLDALTHPMADMVNVRMEILGDPAWISQSQFIPLNGDAFAPGTGVGSDPDIDYWRANRRRIWNEDLQCFNTDVAEPIINLNFRMPTDFNDQTGVYELQTTQSAAFSGLYRVIQVEHNFEDGKFTNVLQMTRFNNQGMPISNPVPTSVVVDKQGESFVVLKSELTKFYADKNFVNLNENLTSIGKKFIDLASAGVSRIKNKVKNKIKGFLS